MVLDRRAEQGRADGSHLFSSIHRMGQAMFREGRAPEILTETLALKI